MRVIIAVLGLTCGIIIGYFLLVNKTPFSPALEKETSKAAINTHKRPTNQVIGFLPYWFINKEDAGVVKYLTTITYFGLTISDDGSILKFSKPTETEPGWHTLNSGKVSQFLEAAKSSKLITSLLVFKANNDAIDTLISDPVTHAQNLLNDVVPTMKQYGFTDLNLDVESTKEASPEAQAKFRQFTKTVKWGLEKEHAGTLTVDVSASDFIKNKLINPGSLKDIADYVLIMAYDYHFPGSIVTGPVAPLGGGGVTYEYDTKIAVQKALEVFLTFKDEKTGSFHQIFYPDVRSTQSKINYAKENKLGGLVWALGYEGNNILSPLNGYIKLQN